MKRYKVIEDGFLTALMESKGTPPNATEINESEYNEILDIVRNKPQDTETTIYKLNASTLTYEPFDAPMPIEPNPFDNPAYMEGYEQCLLDILEMGVEQ